MELQKLQSLIDLLRKNGVLHYEHEGLKLVLGPEQTEAPADPAVPPSVPSDEPPQKLLRHHPSLWVDGQAPSYE